MKQMDILKSLGNVKDAYVIGAEEFRQGKHQTQVKHVSNKRLWLIAAIVALMLLLVGCVAYFLFNVKLKEEFGFVYLVFFVKLRSART